MVKLYPLYPEERILKNSLRFGIEKLSKEIGEHNFLKYQKLEKVANFLETELKETGYKVKKQKYQIGKVYYDNIEVEITGAKKPDEIVIIGGHYDTVANSPGANDNTTGAISVVELAKIFVQEKPDRTLRFVEFVNEEPPFFQTGEMGSLIYAKNSHNKKENIVAMLSLETMGYYSNEKGSQKYPFPLNLFYPDRGNFIAFVGNTDSGDLVRKAILSFRKNTKFPSEGAAPPGIIRGVGWSDQWSFWQEGYQGIMITDTAPFRYPYYHTPQDTADKINYDYLLKG